jgi:hypothetical protein
MGKPNIQTGNINSLSDKASPIVLERLLYCLEMCGEMLKIMKIMVNLGRT